MDGKIMNVQIVVFAYFENLFSVLFMVIFINEFAFYVASLVFLFSGIDALHAYFGICGLSLMKFRDLNLVHPAFNISQRAATHLEWIHEKWDQSRRHAGDDFLVEKHSKFFFRCMEGLPGQATSADVSR